MPGNSFRSIGDRYLIDEWAGHRRAADFVWEYCYIGGFRTLRLVEAVDRRRLLAQREVGLGRRKPPTFVVKVQR